MRAIIKYYMIGRRNAIIKYVDNLKFMGLIDIASECPFDPDYLDRFYIVADFNEPSKKDKIEDEINVDEHLETYYKVSWREDKACIVFQDMNKAITNFRYESIFESDVKLSVISKKEYDKIAKHCRRL